MKNLTLSTVSRITTPAAMVVFMTYEITQSMQVTGAWAWFVLVGAAFTSIGIEIVGIQSGKTMEGFWRIGNINKAVLCFTLLCIYTFAAVYILRNNVTLLPIPVVAAIVYIVSGLSESLEIESAKQAKDDTIRTAFDLKQEALDKEAERKRLADQAQREHEEKLEKLRLDAEIRKAKVERASTEPAQSKVVPARAGYECEDCGRPFATVQALNAHGRFCAGRVAVESNGHI